MRHVLPHSGNVGALAGTIKSFTAGGLASAVTLCGALWFTVAVPNSQFLTSLGGQRDDSVSISLESALLGIDDGGSRGYRATQAARELGLSPGGLLAATTTLPSPAALREAAASHSGQVEAAGALLVDLRTPVISTGAPDPQAPAPSPPAPPAPGAPAPPDNPVQPPAAPPAAAAPPAPPAPAPKPKPSPPVGPTQPAAPPPAVPTPPVAAPAVPAAPPVSPPAPPPPAPDVTPPVIAAHASLVAEATGSGGAVVSFTAPSASDAVDGTVGAACLPASGSLFALGVTHVQCSASDAAHNTATSTFDVTVRDTTPPVITAPDVHAYATSSSGTTVTFSATAVDLVDGTDTVTCNPTSGSTFPSGHTTVTCHTHDAAGNQASASFDVDVNDATAQIATLETTVSGMGVNSGFTNSLDQKLSDASTQLSQGNAAAAGTDLMSALTQVVSEVGANNPKITPTQASQIASSLAQIETTVGTIDSSSILPAAIQAIIDVVAAINSLSLNPPTAHSLLGSATQAGTSVIAGDSATTCQSFDDLTTTANQDLTQQQLDSLLPVVADARTASGC